MVFSEVAMANIFEVSTAMLGEWRASGLAAELWGLRDGLKLTIDMGVLKI